MLSAIRFEISYKINCFDLSSVTNFTITCQSDPIYPFVLFEQTLPEMQNKESESKGWNEIIFSTTSRMSLLASCFSYSSLYAYDIYWRD